MAGILRNESTKEGRDIWRAVDKAASKAPEWAKHKIENAPMQTNRDGEKSHLAVSSSR
jgi:hypothetical protein